MGLFLLALSSAIYCGQRQLPLHHRSELGTKKMPSEPSKEDRNRETLRKSSSEIATTTTKRAPMCLFVYNRNPAFPDPGSPDCLLDYGQSPYLGIMMKTLVGVPLGGSYNPRRIGEMLPYDDRKRRYAADYPPFGYTMIGMRRMDNLRCAIDEVNRLGIEGNIVELGVWRGGAMMFAAAVGKESGIRRDIHLFDIFGAMDAYGGRGQGNKRKVDFLAVTVNEVKDSFKYFELDGPHIHYEVGLFKDTVPAWKGKNASIAVLRIDGNFYDSYQDAMYYMYEKVPVGGFVIFDDLSSWQPAVKRFWKDFRSEQGLVEKPVSIDGGATWFRKVKDVKLDWKHFRPPQDANLEKKKDD